MRARQVRKISQMHHQLGVVHINGEFDQITEIRPLTSRRLN